MTATYALPFDLVKFLNIESTIPDRKVTGSARAKETIGTGDGSTLIFYLDKAYIIADSYSISYGPSEASATALVDTTHYSLNKDNGTLTLTTTGRTEIGTGNIYGAYSYNDLELTNTLIQDALDRAQEQIDNETNNHWSDGTTATPDYQSVVEEKQGGKGAFNRDYFLMNYPIPKLVTTVSSALSISATAVIAGSTNGFPISGYLLIDTNKVQYTGKDTSQHIFLGCSGLTAAHSVGATVIPHVVEISTTGSGINPTWTILALNDDFDIDYDSGRVHVFRTDYDLTYFATQYPPRLVPNRFRTTYLYGNNTIPADIKRVTLMLAVKDLMHTAVRKALLSGHAIERVEQYLVDDKWIEDTIERYKSAKMSNV